MRRIITSQSSKLSQYFSDEGYLTNPTHCPFIEGSSQWRQWNYFSQTVPQVHAFVKSLPRSIRGEITDLFVKIQHTFVMESKRQRLVHRSKDIVLTAQRTPDQYIMLIVNYKGVETRFYHVWVHELLCAEMALFNPDGLAGHLVLYSLKPEREKFQAWFESQYN